MRSKALPFILAAVLLAVIAGAFFFMQNQAQHQGQNEARPVASASALASASPLPSDSASPIAAVSPGASPSVAASPSSATPTSNPSPDLTVDANGLSKATVVVTTNQGVIRFKFYPNDAPKTVKRIIDLINMGFYNGLTFHRVVPGFVIQGGDPTGTGAGGSGVNLKAEFNDRRHVEGTVAMARAQDPDSADSQFYITLGPQPRLDKNYTVFGQVIEGMDVVRRIQVGDKMLTVRVE